MIPILIQTYSIFLSGYFSSYSWINFFVIILGTIGLVGYWKMKKWGVYIYGLMAIVSIGYMISIGMPTVYVHFFSILVMIIGFANIKKMV